MSRKHKYIPYNLNNYLIIKARELGLKRKLGDSDDIAKKIYTNLDLDEPSVRDSNVREGGVFNLEFSFNGKILIAACEERSVLLYDASNQKKFKTINEAHYSCVNCLRFLDETTFATCSDDNTVKLWDTRHLKYAKRTLHGHSNWVKNIEYIEKDQIMVTSAFDGSIYAWDLKSPTENNVLYSKVFVMNGLMRTKLTPDGSKMIICSTSGYIIIIHDLDLATLGNDLRSFRPDMYRLMQSSEQIFPTATIFNHLFNQDRSSNRLEFIDDFPNDAEVISSLQIHPMGWCALSRNINAEENEEWTAVHDIQTRDPKEYADAVRYVDEPAFSLDDENTNRRPTDIWMGFIANEHLSAYRSQASTIPLDNIHTTMGIINSGIIGYRRQLFIRPEEKNRIVLNVPRLTHYVKEKSVGKGYIKELCFSSDGRIVCSPYDKGVRLLAFDENVQELCYCVPERPKELVPIVEMNNYHPDVVVCCKFNPRHYQMVSGCLGGKIRWYKPIL